MKGELIASHVQFSINSLDKNNLNIKRIRVVSTVEYYFQIRSRPVGMPACKFFYPAIGEDALVREKNMIPFKINRFDTRRCKVPFAAVNMKLLHRLLLPHQGPAGVNPTEQSSF